MYLSMVESKRFIYPWQFSLSYISSGCAPLSPHRYRVCATKKFRVKFCYKRPLRLPISNSGSPLRTCLSSEARKSPDFQTDQAEECMSSLPSSIALDLSTSEVDISLLSPMLQHYVMTKRTVRADLDSPPDRSFILMYRVGDFFESFFEDAHILANACEITLTSKDSGKALGKRVPMAGVPHQCLDEKIRLLLDKNVTVAVVDQVQPAASVPSGNLVERAVTRLITPGTACDEALLNARKGSYLASIVVMQSGAVKPARDTKEQQANDDMNLHFGFAYADVSTGEFMATESRGMDALRRLLITISPNEVLLAVPLAFEKTALTVRREIKNAGVGVVSGRQLPPLDTAEQILCRYHGIDNVESVGCRGKPLCTESAAVLLTFVEKMVGLQTAEKDPLLFNKLQTFSVSETMLLDGACLKNLEVLETVRDGVKERSLQWAVDRTVTAMGARCLRKWLVNPPLCLETMLRRQNAIESLMKDKCRGASKVQAMLRGISDLERLGAGLIHRRISPRELQSLCKSILLIPSVINTMRSCIEEHLPQEMKSPLVQSLLDPVDSSVLTLSTKVLDALVDPAPPSLPSQLSSPASTSRECFTTSGAQIFRLGYSPLLDELREKLGAPESWIKTIEDKEKDRTEIDSLRIKHIKNVGYVVRIPRATGEKIMNEDPTFFKRLGYQQVQSTKVELRFRFEELLAAEKEFQIGFSQIVTLELDMYGELRDIMRCHVRHLRSLGSRIAQIDVLAGLARVALEQRYEKPVLLPQSHCVLELQDIRHPVVEQTLPNGKTYVPNSFHLGKAYCNTHPDVIILCGPNAAGKSCFLRSVGLIMILAQIGSFVPAGYAKLSICDRIFTRVGAVDDLSRGQSTFQVEMAETSCILSHATSSSLVLLDEIGRGTSAVDGVAIAWSVSEFLAQRPFDRAQPPRSIFVTHYHELNHLSELYDNVQSFHMHVEQTPSRTRARRAIDDLDWVATYNVRPGPTYDSFGIAIAQRAGLPKIVIERAYKVAKLLQMPSEIVRSELRKGLAQDTEKVFDISTKRIKKGVDAQKHDNHDEIYLSGFEQGYRAALSEVHTNFSNVMTRLSSEQTHGFR